MKNLFKYAGTYWKAMLVIIAVLILQAYCDLSLPAYTSDIVNVGIQQGGIEDKVPVAVGAEDMEKILLFVSDKDQERIVNSYEKDDVSYDVEAYVLKDTVKEDEEKKEELSDVMALPMMMTTGLESGSDMTKELEEQMKANSAQGILPEEMDIFDMLKVMPAEQREAFVEEAAKQMEDMPDTILEQAAISFAKTAYEKLGMDTDSMQIHYLLATGEKMIALAFLGMAASVLVGFMASRVGASTGQGSEKQGISEGSWILQ